MTKDNVFMFTAGVIGGAAGMLIAVKKYYEHMADEDIKSVKETYPNQFSPENYANIRDTSNENLHIVTGKHKYIIF